MSQTTTPDAEQAEPQYKAELLSRIDRAWSSLQDTINELTEAQLTAIRDQQGWTVKDHLVHLTAWQQSLLALLQGRDRMQAMGLNGIDRATMDVDDVNNLIYQRNQHRTIDDVRTAFQRSHAEVRSVVESLSDADLLKPYSHYQPNDPPAEDAPVFGWIVGNTYEHYAEHREWIQNMLSAQTESQPNQ